MAIGQYFAREWKSIPSESANSEVASPCFDCNICLDFANDPVVTLCGHLYCWPCIYKWFQVQSDDENPQCPVCKAQISRSTLIPLYGRGQAQSEAQPEGKAHHEMPIPPRPPACGPHVLMTSSNHGQQLPYRNDYANPHYQPQFNFADNTVGVFGEMVYARVFGNSESLYAYPNSYHLVGSSSARLRRQEMQADKCLNRISIFLMCCLFLCLFLF